MTDAKWRKLKAEYIAGNGNCRELAEKYGVSPRSVSERCAKEKWRGDRKNSEKNTVKTTVKRTIEKNAEKQADFLAKAGDVSDKLLDYCVELLEQTKENGGSGRDAKYLADSVKTLVSVLRDVRGIPTQAEAEAQRIAAERLELDRARARAEADKDNTLVVEIAGSAKEWAQ